MSVYSGFSTRQQEVAYNRLTESLLFLLKDRVHAAEHHEVAPDTFWLEQFAGVYGQMNRMEAHKYFPPKLSQCVRDLAGEYGATDWEERFSLSSDRKKPRTVLPKHRYGQSHHMSKSFIAAKVQPVADLFLPLPATHTRPRRRKRQVAKPSYRESSSKQTIEWADLKPRSRNYYSGLMMKKLASPGSVQLPWKDF